MINKIKNLINLNNLDGYIVPKNDQYFSEYAFPDRLKKISNFRGSAGFAIIMTNKNLQVLDSRTGLNIFKLPIKAQTETIIKFS